MESIKLTTEIFTIFHRYYVEQQ